MSRIDRDSPTSARANAAVHPPTLYVSCHAFRSWMHVLNVRGQVRAAGIAAMNRACTFALLLLAWLLCPRTEAMDFTLGDFVSDSTTTVATKLSLTGEIEAGDTERFSGAGDFRFGQCCHFASEGLSRFERRRCGEAMSLAKALGALYPNVYVTNSCASSCLLLYLAGAFRTVQHGGRVGVHRPTFYFS